MPPRLRPLREALARLHEPAPGLDAAALEDRSHPAWERLKFDELLAQQLSLKVHRRARARRKAPRLPGDATLTRALLQRLPFALTQVPELQPAG